MKIRRLPGVLLFWLLFAVLFGYAQTVLVPKDTARDTGNLLNHLVTPYTNATRTRAFEALPPDSVDIAFVGSSTVFCSVNPVQLYAEHGIAAQDYAVGAMTGGLTEYVTQIVLESQHPRYVLLDGTRLYADYVNQSANYLVPFTRLTPAKVALAAQGGDLTTAAERLVPLLLCHQNWVDVDADDFRFAFSPIADPFLGMVGMIHPAADAQALADRFARPAMDFATYVPDVNPTLTDTAKAQLRRFQALCVAQGAQPVVMVAPSVFGNENTRFLLQLEAYTQAQGMAFVNFNVQRQGLTLTADDFADDHHLTITGMEKFTHVLGDYLAAQYPTPDRRGDAAFARYEAAQPILRQALAALAPQREVE